MSNLKRKHVNITIQQKLDILKELENGKSAKRLAFEYNIGCSTVHDIKKNKGKLLNYSMLVSESIHGNENRKTMKRSPYELLDRALIHWFNHERAQGKAITGPMCAKQAKVLFNTIGLAGNFDASSGWLARFKDRYGIRSVGNSLDCIWTIGVAEPKHFEGEAPVLVNDEGEAQIDYENLEMECGNENVLHNDSPTIEQPVVEGAVYSTEHSICDEVTTNHLLSQDSNCNANKSEIEMSSQTKSGSQDVSGRKTTDYELKNLKYLVEKLEMVTNKLTDLGDNYDHFGRYISLLLKGLPPKNVLYLKQKIVSDVLQTVLAHERGITEESLSSCNHEFDSCQSKTKISSSKKKIFNGLSKVNVDKDTNTNSCKRVPNLSSLSTKTTKKRNVTTNMFIDTHQNSSYFSLPCSYGNIMPDDRSHASADDVISDDHPNFFVQRSDNNNESAENISDSSLSYFPVVSIDVSPNSLDTISSGRINRRQKCTKSEFTTSKSNQEAASIQYRPNDGSHEVYLEEPIELKKETEEDETIFLDPSCKVKVESSCQNEELDETVPDCGLTELIICGLCFTECASKDFLVYHFTHSHPGCVPISRKRTCAELSHEPS